MFIIQTNHDNVLDELIAIEVDCEVATRKFLDTCETVVFNWCDYTSDDIESILGNGFVEYGGNRAVVLIDGSNVKSDSDIASEIRQEPIGNMKIERWVLDGEIPSDMVEDIDDLLAACGANLDSACSWDIQGEILFKGSNGRWYTVTTESTVAEANPEWLATTLKELKESA